jgi:hypothetical protein
MPAGDISKKYATIILERLKDMQLKIVPGFNAIYQDLSELQRQWMLRFKIPHTQTIPVVAGTYIYDLSPVIHGIYKVGTDNGDIEEMMHFIDPIGWTIEIPEDFLDAGDNIIVRGYLKPGQDTGVVIDSTFISATVDPVIGQEFYMLLVYGYLSRYSEVNPEFESKKEIENQVRRLALSLRPGDYTPVISGKVRM